MKAGEPAKFAAKNKMIRNKVKIASTRWPIPFWKMSGAGNDFVIIDHRVAMVAPDAMSAFARLVCRRKFAVGADGLFFIEQSDKADFKWRFFNADGSEAEMCGNGARCVARFAYMNGIAAAKMCFETLAGIVQASVEDTAVTVRMTTPHSLVLDKEISLAGDKLQVHLLNTGVPHAIVFVEEIEGIDVQKRGAALRHHHEFAPAGTNVNFVAIDKETLQIRTYERGVEDETFACGTGAVAAALIASLLGKVTSPAQVITSGGITLSVLFSGQGAGNNFESVYLKGPAHLIYTGELTAESLL
jgi:diaminopimelate epimerase